MLMAICRYFGHCLVNCRSLANKNIWPDIWGNEYKCLYKVVCDFLWRR